MKNIVHGRAALLFLAFAGLLPCYAPLDAQVYKRIAPSKPTPPPAVKPVLPAPHVASASTANRVILKKLKGLVFVSDIKEFDKTGFKGKLSAIGINVRNVPLLTAPGFIKKIAPFIGQPFTLADIAKISHIVVAWYSKGGHALMDVTIPPQNISSGVIQVIVTQYRVGKVEVTGNKWFSSTLLRNESGIQVGKPISLGQLRGDLNWLNSNPFRQVNAVFSPGALPGQTDVDLQTKDQLPLRGYAGFDNQGVPTLGRSEYNVGFNWGDAFWLDQQLSYQYTRSLSGQYSAHSLDWMIPLPWRDRLIIFGSYEQEKPALGSGFSSIGQSGQASLRYMHPLPTLSWLTEDIGVGYDFKTTNNNLEFGGTQVGTSQNSLNQLLFLYDATETDPWGNTAIKNQFVASVGAIRGQTNVSNQTYPSSYVYDQFELNRITFLPWGFSSATRFLGQVADHNLPDSETLDAGGVGSVRGYNPETDLGSEGELISEEIRAPAFDPAGFLNLPTPLHSAAQFGVFIDYADVYQVQTVADSINRADLASAGVDLHYAVGNSVNVEMDYGQQLRRAPGYSSRGGEFDISVTVSF
ncbi:MAG: ShlB/FhaC/HecB family hemolysin secretion/activation protein [Phycisphaerae bacterium]